MRGEFPNCETTDLPVGPAGSFPYEEMLAARLEFAYQPIVHASTGRVYGYEALLRNYDTAGFPSAFALFDHAYEERNLYALDLILRRKAIEGFVQLSDVSGKRLFYNLDNRLLDMPDYRTGNTQKTLGEFGLPASVMVFEISERHQFQSIDRLREIIVHYREQGYRIAVDDYGVGFSGLQLIHSVEPDIIKLDRFFVTGLDHDPRRQIFLQNVIQLAHLMGGMVVAEGIETAEESRACVKIGCDLLQGFFLGRPLPATDPEAGQVKALREIPERVSFSHTRSAPEIQRIQPIRSGMDIDEILAIFRSNPSHSVFPVVNEYDEPLGLLDESSLKEVTYSRYGKELLAHRDAPGFLRGFMRRCHVADVHSSADEMLKIFSLQDAIESGDGIIMVDAGRYNGFLSSASMLRFLYQDRIESAREENPLTGLPGNRSIMRFLAAASESSESTTLVYLDVDHFKPFNDRYGFQKGDQALLAIAESLKHVYRSDHPVFVGHVGGDDFFLGFSATALPDVMGEVERIRGDFASALLPVLDPMDRQQCIIRSVDRNGMESCFPVPSLTAAVLVFEFGRVPLDDVSGLVADLKSKAKASQQGILVQHYPDGMQKKTLLAEG